MRHFFSSKCVFLLKLMLLAVFVIVTRVVRAQTIKKKLWFFHFRTWFYFILLLKAVFIPFFSFHFVFFSFFFFMKFNVLILKLCQIVNIYFCVNITLFPTPDFRLVFFHILNTFVSLSRTVWTCLIYVFFFIYSCRYTYSDLHTSSNLFMLDRSQVPHSLSPFHTFSLFEMKWISCFLFLFFCLNLSVLGYIKADIKMCFIVHAHNTNTEISAMIKMKISLRMTRTRTKTSAVKVEYILLFLS